MINVLRSNESFGRVLRALLIALLADAVLGIFALFVYSTVPSSATARVLDVLNAPVEVLTLWVVAGHTFLQPLVDMLLIVIITWGAMWVGLNAFSLGRSRY
jgi:hypothetical protein